MSNKTLTGLDVKIQEMAGRIRDLREITGFTPEEMAVATGVSVEEYLANESGEGDLTFAFIYRCRRFCRCSPGRQSRPGP